MEQKALIISKQEEIQNKLALINKALNGIQTVNGKTFKTNGMFQFSPAGTSINIKEQRNVHTLIEMVSFLNAKQTGYDKAAEEMELQTYPQFKWCGNTTEDWKHDIKTRISVLTSHEKKETLLKAKAILEKYVTEETKMLQDLQSIDELIGFKEVSI